MQGRLVEGVSRPAKLATAVPRTGSIVQLEKTSAFLAQGLAALERKYYPADAWEKRLSLQ